MASILIVDDNAQFRNLLSLALSRGNHTVTEADNGAKAIELIRRISFDVVISDVVMPEKDGIEMLLQMRSMKPSLPIIMMSGDSPAHADLYLKIARQLGAVNLLRKPFKVEELEAAIAALGL